MGAFCAHGAGWKVCENDRREEHGPRFLVLVKTAGDRQRLGSRSLVPLTSMP